MHRNAMVMLLSIGALLTLTANAQAFPITWSANNHTYDIVLVDGNPTWYEALDAAASISHNGITGHLATLTTAAEQNFVIDSFGGGSAIDVLWVGGYQDTADPSYTEPGGGWKWITGEAWNTGPEAPAFSFNNNYWYHYTEEHLVTWWGTGGLNDWYYAPDPNIEATIARGFIVEFDAAPVPEPATILLLGTGLIGLAGARRKLKG